MFELREDDRLYPKKIAILFVVALVAVALVFGIIYLVAYMTVPL